ncbi:Msb1/Mug8 domain-containing protein [Microdochium nivale]|nr:Msb1/Mug8 domain-containing protein [Microdochium nivale]
MPSLFSKIRGKDGLGKAKSKKGNGDDSALQLPVRQRWEDAYIRTSVEPEEMQDLVRRCTAELKARALDHPFLLLPFRPTSDPSAVRTFVRHFFNGDQNLQGEALAQEIRMTEPMVIAGVLKWCWSRLPGGIVGWDAYELFRVGESDSNMARDSFSTFIPLSVENPARSQIIFDYFELLSAMAAHGKTNGFGGRKLSRMAAWWAFEHKNLGAGFEGGYKSWLSAADATSHLFFAYLRSISPSQTRAGIAMLPMSLQKLLQETEYPPQLPSLMQSSTHRVVMIVETVSPTPFSLLRRANHFQYRENDRALREYSEYEDPVEALTEECQRVLKAISLANQSQVSSLKHSTGLRDASWSRFEDIGFSGALDDDDEEEVTTNKAREFARGGLRTTPASGGMGLDRPTTPSWADFLNAGFVDDGSNGTRNFLLPPDKVLPPIETSSRQRSSQSHRPRLESDRNLEPGELASITPFDLDDAFWWVWMSSLAPEETAERKSAFGRCAVIETVIRSGRWLVIEEIIKGAAAEPNEGAYIAEKKGFFSWTRRSKTGSRRGKTAKGDGKGDSSMSASASKASIAPDQQAKIQAAAQELQAKEMREQQLANALPVRRGRTDAELLGDKTNSVMTLQPAVMSAASPAMKWANKYDKDAIREAYLADKKQGTKGETNGSFVTNGHASYQDRPVVPEKPLPSPLSFVPEARREPEKLRSPNPAAAVSSADMHSNEMAGMTGRNSPLPPVPKEHEEAIEARGTMLSPEPDAALGGKGQKKLHKEENKAGGGGFRKLFGRKNRQSKLPENAAGDVNTMLAQDESQRAAAASPTPTPTAPTQQEIPAARAVTPEPIEQPRTPSPPESIIENMEPTFEPPTEDNVSRVDTVDAMEAQDEFSRFDQGPLADQPAFVPGDDLTDGEDATPPPIARRSLAAPQQRSVSEESIENTVPPAIDRWAQIRKNAAERAAARQQDEETRAPTRAYSKTTTDDGDDDTSGEETIESRVARIKARVAELTGNMEGTNAPGQGPGQAQYSKPPPFRR